MTSNLAGYQRMNEDAVMIRSIYDWFGTKYGDVYKGCIPQNYLAFDLETIGAKRTEDLVTMVGFVVVEGGEPQYYEGILLNWYEYDAVDANGRSLLSHTWLDQKLTRLSYVMKDNWHGISPEVLKERGKPPLEVLEYTLKLFEEQRDKGAVFAAHNLLRTDAPIITNALNEFVGAEWQFYDNEILDTAAIEKAAVAGIDPMPAETITAYFKRVLGVRSKVKYGMDSCIAKYGFEKSYDFDLAERHQADFDALLVHYLLEEHREIVGC